MVMNTFKALFAMKIPSHMQGFDYVEDAMELYNRNNAPFTNMKLLYFYVGQKNKVSSSTVMKAISDLIDYAYEKGNKGETIKYFGLTRRSNGNHLAVLYQRLKEEKGARDKDK